VAQLFAGIFDVYDNPVQLGFFAWFQCNIGPDMPFNHQSLHYEWDVECRFPRAGNSGHNDAERWFQRGCVRGIKYDYLFFGLAGPIGDFHWIKTFTIGLKKGKRGRNDRWGLFVAMAFERQRRDGTERCQGPRLRKRYCLFMAFQKDVQENQWAPESVDMGRHIIENGPCTPNAAHNAKFFVPGVGLEPLLGCPQEHILWSSRRAAEPTLANKADGLLMAHYLNEVVPLFPVSSNDSTCVFLFTLHQCMPSHVVGSIRCTW
jgi:hypothetical protein